MTEDSQPKNRRWDPLVKVTHWGIVAAIIGNALITEEGSGWHIWVGYGLAGRLALRLLWGLMGPKEARFSAFPPSFTRAFAHVREIRQGIVKPHHSHNPLGALMVYAIWACLLVIIISGIAMSGPPPANPAQAQEAHEALNIAPAVKNAEEEEEEEQEGVGQGAEAGETEDMMEEVHEVAVNILYLLIALHIAGVIFETRRSGPHIARAMLPFHGQKQP